MFLIADAKAKAIADEVATPARSAAGGAVGRGRAARARRSWPSGPGGRRGDAGADVRRVHRRRVVDGPGEGHRAHDRAAHPGRAHDVRRQRDDADLRADRLGEHKRDRSVAGVAPVLPKIVVYDPVLTLGPAAAASPDRARSTPSPTRVEALYAPWPQPDHLAIALEGVRAIAPVAAGRRHARPAPTSTGRSDLLYGACLAGVALGATATALHHKLCHVLGGHATTSSTPTRTSVVLPHAVALNAPGAPEEMGRLAEALGAPDGMPPARSGTSPSASDVPTEPGCARPALRRSAPRRLSGPPRDHGEPRAGRRRLGALALLERA